MVFSRRMSRSLSKGFSVLTIASVLLGTLPVNLVFSEEVLPVTDSGVTVEDGVGDASAGDEVGGEIQREVVEENEATEFEEVSMDFSEFKTGAVSVLGNNEDGGESDCGNSVKEEGEQCDGTDGVPNESVGIYCTDKCKLDYVSGSERVTICHRTASDSHPYQVNHPSKMGDVSGHDGHDAQTQDGTIVEGIWTPNTTLKKWGDIIPPFWYIDQSTKQVKQYKGKNLTEEGLAILNNDCKIPGQTGSLQVDKEIDLDGTGTYEPYEPASDPVFQWYLDDDPDLMDMGTTLNIFDGTYYVSETDVEGYHFTGWYSIKNDDSYSCANPEDTTYPVPVTVSTEDPSASQIVLCNAKDTAPISYCGDGILDDGEACDYGSLNGQSSCSETCTWVYACLPEMAANGSFETPVVETAQKWNAFPSELVPGWTAEWYGGSSDFNGHTRPAPMIELHSGVNGWTSADGLQHAELDSDWTGPIGDFSNEPASISLYQDIPVLGGYEYKVSWQYAPRPNHGNNHLQVMVDDVEALDTGVIAGGSTIAWSSHEYTFTADSDGVVRVRFTERGTPDSLGMLLDDVSVECLGQAYVCVDGPAWAYSVESAFQGTLYNGSTITDPIRVDPDKALGATDGAFFSLGEGGSLVLVFDHYVMNVDGDDLSVNETTWERLSDIEEKARVSVSQDGSNWTDLGEASSFSDGDGNGTRDGMSKFDLGDLPWIRYVKLEESSVGQIASDDGFDIDSVLAVHGVCEEPVMCGDGKKSGDEECDGTDGVTEGENFCTPTCQLIPIYDGDHACSGETVPVRLDVSYLIDAKNPTGVSVPLLGGQEYLFEISGTYQFGHETRRSADAAYATEDSWSKIRGDIGIWGTAYRGVTSVLGELGRGVGVVEWDDDSAVDDDHIYQKAFMPDEDMTATFLISDWYGDWYGNTCDGQGCMSDNSGSIELEVYECRPTTDVKVCKEDTSGTPLPGWGMLLASERVDGPTEINVSSPAGTHSAELPAGTYLLKVSGTYRYGSSLMNADAGFSYRPESIPSGCDCWLSGFELASDSNGLMAWVNGGDVDWGVYNRAHEYLYVYEHDGGPINFSIWDNNYGDNVNNGNFQFEIFELVDRGTTGNDGCVAFEDVAYDNYYLDEMLQENWDRNSGTGVITIDDAEEDFTVVNEQHTGNLTVCKFNDLDKDGEKDRKEWNIKWDISVKNAVNDDMGNGTWDKKDRCYHWTLPVGSYTVEEEVRDGWVQTFGENPTDVEITDGGSEEVLFGNFRFGEIHGRKFEDYNGNGRWDTNGKEQEISGWEMHLYRETEDGWRKIREDVTNEEGRYSFRRLPLGQYYVCEVNQEGWTQTAPSIPDKRVTFGVLSEYPIGNQSPDPDESPVCWAVSITAPQSPLERVNRGLHFGNFQLGFLQGRKYEDVNTNGVFDVEGDRLLDGWNIRLYDNEWVQMGKDHMTGETGKDGQYRFEDLEKGDYYICEVQQEGWEQTGPVMTIADSVFEDAQDNTLELSAKTDELAALLPYLSGRHPVENASGAEDEGAVCWKATINHSGQSRKGLKFGNFTSAELTIAKSNDREGIDLHTGDTVTYTLTVSALHNDVSGVTVHDVAPKGFVVTGQKCDLEPSTTRGISAIGPYHPSPCLIESYGDDNAGVWYVGDLTKGTSVSWSYTAVISEEVDPGEFPDVAWAQGWSALGTGSETPDVLAYDASDETKENPFVGTRVLVVAPVIAQAGVVLGTATERLAQTGQNILAFVLGGVALLTGVAVLLYGKTILEKLLRRGKDGKQDSDEASAASVPAAVVIAILLGTIASPVNAASHLKVMINTPTATVTTSDMSLGFVATDIDGRDVSVECSTRPSGDTSEGTVFDTVVLPGGGGAGSCRVDSTEMPAAGTYEFRVIAVAGVETSEPSKWVSVVYDPVGPSPVVSYSKEKISTCVYKISFTTANDGQTSSVQIFRSNLQSFSADSSTYVTTVTVGPDSSASYTDSSAPCQEPVYYVVRAVDSAGNTSSFVGDKVTVTETVIVPAPVQEAGGGEGAVAGEAAAAIEGAVDENENGIPDSQETGENGEVLGGSDDVSAGEGDSSDEDEEGKSDDDGGVDWGRLFTYGGIVVAVAGAGYLISTVIAGKRR